MKKTLTIRETLAITSMLFGLFFGAGNLIFPALLGQQAGSAVLPALLGFLVTGVGLPLLTVISLGITGSNGLLELSGIVGKRFAYIFTIALYLTIGPFFAIPRCVTVPFEVGVRSFLPADMNTHIALLVFSMIFLTITLLVSLRPGKILTYVGKVLNPIFLIVLGILVFTAVFHHVSTEGFAPAASYEQHAFIQGVLDGYNTMDALAGLAFGIIVVTVIKNLGIREQGDIAKSTVKAGIFSCALMAVIYLLVALTGTYSLSYLAPQENGSLVLAGAASHFFTSAGQILLALIVFFACLKTDIGLVTSCATAFEEMFPGKLTYRQWVVLFCSVTFLIANLGLNAIITISVPVLVMLYPIAIVLTLLAICGKWYHHDINIIRGAMIMAVASSLLDFLHALPAAWMAEVHLDRFILFIEEHLPFYSLGFGWICPTIVGVLAGLITSHLTRRWNHKALDTYSAAHGATITTDMKR